MIRFPRLAPGVLLLVVLVGCGSSQAVSDLDTNERNDWLATDLAHGPEVRADLTVPDGVACDFSVEHPFAWSGEGAPVQFSVGGFRLALAADGELSVVHSDDMNNVLISTSVGEHMTLAQALLEGSHAQGSYDITEKIDAECAGARIERVYYSGAGLKLVARWEQGACSGKEMHVSFCEPQEGHLQFRIGSQKGQADAATFFKFRCPVDEGFYGMGHQFLHDTLNLKGKVVPVLAQEGGIGRGDEKVSKVMETISPGTSGTELSTYFPMAHFLTDRNRSLALENQEISFFDFSADESVELRVYSHEMVGRLFHATGPLEHIERFTEYTGRMPKLPEWVGIGAIVAMAQNTMEAIANYEKLVEAGVPVAAVWNQRWCGGVKTFVGEQVLWNWAYNNNYHPKWDEYKAYLRSKGVKNLCYINPMVVQLPEDETGLRRLFEEGEAGGYFVKDAQGKTLISTHTAFDVATVDLSYPAAREWLKGVIKTEMMERAGCDGWMADYAEALPFDAVMHLGESGEQYHNRFAVEWIKLQRELLEESATLGEVLVFSRSGLTQTPGAAIAVWQGDQVTSWDRFDGMQSALHGLLNGAYSGIAINHSDVGGYTTVPLVGPEYSRTLELHQRWTEMNAFTAILRTHEGNSPSGNVQVYSDPEAMAHFAEFARLYAALAPYRQELMEHSSQRGWPLVRPMALHYPDDEKAWTIVDQFMLGDQILVAPTLAPCADEKCRRELYLPEGRWIHAWSSTLHEAGKEGLSIGVDAPVGRPAVFYRAGFQWPDNI